VNPPPSFGAEGGGAAGVGGAGIAGADLLGRAGGVGVVDVNDGDACTSLAGGGAGFETTGGAITTVAAF
jgi:hypothetical protein